MSGVLDLRPVDGKRLCSCNFRGALFKWVVSWVHAFILPGPPKVCKIMALMAVVMGLGLLFHILLG